MKNPDEVVAEKLREVTPFVYAHEESPPLPHLIDFVPFNGENFAAKFHEGQVLRYERDGEHTDFVVDTVKPGPNGSVTLSVSTVAE